MDSLNFPGLAVSSDLNVCSTPGIGIVSSTTDPSDSTMHVMCLARFASPPWALMALRTMASASSSPFAPTTVFAPTTGSGVLGPVTSLVFGRPENCSPSVRSTAYSSARRPPPPSSKTTATVERTVRILASRLGAATGAAGSRLPPFNSSAVHFISSGSWRSANEAAQRKLGGAAPPYPLPDASCNPPDRFLCPPLLASAICQITGAEPAGSRGSRGTELTFTKRGALHVRNVFWQGQSHVSEQRAFETARGRDARSTLRALHLSD